MEDFMIMDKMVDVTMSKIQYESCLHELSIIGGGRVNYFLEDGENKNFIEKIIDDIKKLLNNFLDLFRKKKIDERISKIKGNPILMKEKIKMHDIKALQKAYDDAKSDAEKARTLEDLEEAKKRYKEKREDIIYKTVKTTCVTTLIGSAAVIGGTLLYVFNDNVHKKVDDTMVSIRKAKGIRNTKKYIKKNFKDIKSIENNKIKADDENDILQQRYANFLSAIAADMIKDSNTTISSFFDQLSNKDKKKLTNRMNDIIASNDHKVRKDVATMMNLTDSNLKRKDHKYDKQGMHG